MTINTWPCTQLFMPFQPNNPKLTVGVVRSGELHAAIDNHIALDQFFARFSSPDEPLEYYISHTTKFVCCNNSLVFHNNAVLPECTEECPKNQYWIDLDYFYEVPSENSELKMCCCYVSYKTGVRKPIYDFHKCLQPAIHNILDGHSFRLYMGPVCKQPIFIVNNQN
jgi:hypothetical protein